MKTTPVIYAGRGYTVTTRWGRTASVNVGIADPAARLAANPLLMYNPDPDLLPGIANPTAPDAPPNASNVFDGGFQQGHLWDSALRAGLDGAQLRLLRRRAALRHRHAHSASHSALHATRPTPTAAPPSPTPPTPRWRRSPIPTSAASTTSSPTSTGRRSGSGSSTAIVDAGTLPNLELVRLMHDHTGQLRHRASTG